VRADAPTSSARPFWSPIPRGCATQRCSDGLSALATLYVEKDCSRVEAAGFEHESSNTVMIGPSPRTGRKGEYGIEVLADVGLFAALEGLLAHLEGPADAGLADGEASLAEGEEGLQDG